MLNSYRIHHHESQLVKEFANTTISNVDIKNLDVLIAYIKNQTILLRQELPQLHFYLSSLQDEALKVTDVPEHQHPALITLILASLVNAQIVKEYDHGVWIKTIENTADSLDKMGRPSSKDNKKFYLHTDLSYTEKPPIAFLFHCLINDLSLGGKTVLCNLSKVHSQLSMKSYTELQKPQFVFPAPSYYGKTASVIYPILGFVDGKEIIRFRRDNLYALSKDGMRAVAELNQLIDENHFLVDLQPNEALIINNHRHLHGRQGYIVKKVKQRFFNQVYFNVN